MWCASVLLVTPAASRATAAQIMAQVSGNPHDAAPESFSIPVCAIGGGYLTHWACHTRVRSATLVQLPALADLLVGLLWGVTQHDDDTDEQRRARPTFEQLLEGWGLARLVDPETLDDDDP